MSVDAVESAGGSADIFDSEGLRWEYDAPPWNGRDVEHLSEKKLMLVLISQFYAVALQQMEGTANVPMGGCSYELLTEEISAILSSNFDQDEESIDLLPLHCPSDREFALADLKQYQAELIPCKSILKRVAKGAKAAKKVAEFVKEHKKEILIGAAVLAAVVGTWVIAGALSGAAAVGANATGEGRKREDEEDLKLHDSSQPSSSPPPADTPLPDVSRHFQSVPSFLENLQSGKTEREKKPAFDLSYKNDTGKQGGNAAAVPSTFPSVDSCSSAKVSLHLRNSLISFLQNLQSSKNDTDPKPAFDLYYKIDTGKQGSDVAIAPSVPSAAESSSNLNLPYSQILPYKLFGSFFEIELGPSLLSLLDPPSSPLYGHVYESCHVQTEGNKQLGIGVGFINGMNAFFPEHMSHLNHTKKFAGDIRIDGVYNHSNTLPGDVLEIFFINYQGAAPKTANLLLENWTKFHEENKNNPDAKYLQFTHSMGNILTKNALLQAPQEIRDRVIVVAIAPAVIIPKGLCYDSFHYASQKDLVHYGEDFYTHCIAENYDESDRQELFKQLAENKKRLILLEPHPDAKGMDHDFESPTFDKVLERHFENYLEKNG
jgi:hypothetical protein